MTVPVFTFCDRRFFKGVMLKGTIEVLTDPASKRINLVAGRYNVL